VAHVEQVEHPVGQHNLPAKPAMLGQHLAKTVPGQDFFSRIHAS
jgi:hypothetical protein